MSGAVPLLPRVCPHCMYDDNCTFPFTSWSSDTAQKGPLWVIITCSQYRSKYYQTKRFTIKWGLSTGKKWCKYGIAPLKCFIVSVYIACLLGYLFVVILLQVLIIIIYISVSWHLQ